ncbi:MAG: hypothetical protein GXP35_15350 [Actinobacteria bacterium]|nr:hypothetical protein [Actinomycetota bacterium]
MTASWQQRFDSARPTYTRVNEKRFADLEAGTSVLIPSPQDIEREINGVGSGETIDLSELRVRLANRHGADGSCPVMTGMNLRIVAELSFEALDCGAAPDEVTPVWRAVCPTSNLATKLRGGSDRLTALIAGESC